ncbi:MAG: sigma 54-interacting transcriptional regulator [Planctomycetes bacterium]|nr:sigma 54-interacting transcriptional regulator [Planctomycetota bacterium]
MCYALEIIRRGERLALVPLTAGARLTVGRDEGCEVTVDDHHLSRRHFAVELQSDHTLTVTDLGSKNHTKVDDREITETRIDQESLITFGECRAFLRYVGSRNGSAVDLQETRTDEIPATDSRYYLSPETASSSERPALEAIYSLSASLLRRVTFEELFENVERCLTQILAPRRIILGLADQGSTEESVHAWGSADGHDVPMSRTILDAARVQRRASIVRLSGRRDSSSVKDLGIRCYMVAPLILESQYLGYLYADRSAGRDFSRSELEFLQGVAQVTALGIERLRSVETLERDAEKLRGIFDRRGGFVAHSKIMVDLLRRVERVSRMESPVLIQGETGTGKELIAQMVHDLSPRRGGPFVAFNCALSSPDLIESELFGHNAGAFTGAAQARKGRFALAHGGTLFLDEVGDMPPSTQVKLLRAIQEKQVWPVGSETPVSVDIRIISATHKNLTSLRKQGEFREDLYYRLSVLPIDLPPLRRRDDDVVAIAVSMLPEGLSLDDGALEALRAYDWPGNVRELANAIEQGVFNASGKTIHRRDLPPIVHRMGRRTRPELSPLSPVAVEKKHIQSTLELAGGNKQRTAEILGISRTTLYQKLKQYGI